MTWWRRNTLPLPNWLFYQSKPTARKLSILSALGKQHILDSSAKSDRTNCKKPESRAHAASWKRFLMSTLALQPHGKDRARCRQTVSCCDNLLKQGKTETKEYHHNILSLLSRQRKTKDKQLTKGTKAPLIGRERIKAGGEVASISPTWPLRGVERDRRTPKYKQRDSRLILPSTDKMRPLEQAKTEKRRGEISPENKVGGKTPLIRLFLSHLPTQSPAQTRTTGPHLTSSQLPTQDRSQILEQESERSLTSLLLQLAITTTISEKLAGGKAD